MWVHREEKTEQLMDSKHEVERLEQELQRFKQEVNSFLFRAFNVGSTGGKESVTKEIEGIRYTSQFVFSIFYRLMLFVKYLL